MRLQIVITYLIVFAYSLNGCICSVTQVYPPSLLLSPSILSTMSSHADLERDISPDSGHRELSTDSLATSGNTQSDVSWHSALAASTTYHHDLAVAGRLHSTMMSSQTCPVIASHHAAGAGLQQLSMSDVPKTAQLDPASQRSLASDTGDVCGRVLKNASLQGRWLMLSPDSRASLSSAEKSFSCGDTQFFENEDSTLGGEDGKSFLDDSDVLAAHSMTDVPQQQH